jgi:hypothetical protein
VGEEAGRRGIKGRFPNKTRPKKTRLSNRRVYPKIMSPLLTTQLPGPVRLTPFLFLAEEYMHET